MTSSLLIVGAGLFGAVMAERLAAAGYPVTVIDRRPHIGGNCWSETDPQTGIEVHKYGSHIFHTSNREVWEYISRFTDWNSYQHHVWTTYQGRVYSMPINLATINGLYGMSLNPREAEEFIAGEIARENLVEPKNLEEKAISLIGRPLYEAFIRGYTIKQWQKDPATLPPEIITRLPVRFSYNSRYFNDVWEGIPLDGYGKLFERLFSDSRITVRLNTDWFDLRDSVDDDTLVVYTGAIDRFFDCRLGALEWRAIDFEAERFDIPDFQGTSVINNADATTPYTRIHEFRHYHPERSYPDKTIIFREYSRSASSADEPYYPVGDERNRRLYAAYQDLAAQLSNVIFGGRLGSYRYYDMDDVIAAALEESDRLVERLERQREEK